MKTARVVGLDGKERVVWVFRSDDPEALLHLLIYGEVWIEPTAPKDSPPAQTPA